MSIEHIVICTESFHSKNIKNIVSSNTAYVTKLFQNNLREDKIYQDALYSYYVDYYLSHILHGGFGDFRKNFSKRHKTLYYIRHGLEALGAKDHLALFNAIFPLNTEGETDISNNRLFYRFKQIEQKNPLMQLNHKWLTNHPNLLIMNPEYIDRKVQEHSKEQKEEKRHIKIIKKLCEIIEEDFIEVTAGDSNNIYQKAWHFKTAQSYYYMIEKKNIVTLYNSFNKRRVTQGRLIANNTDKSTFSNFFTKILA